MSNRFVSAGKIGSSGEVSKESNVTESNAGQPLHSSAKSKEWEAVEQQLEAERKRREEQRVKAATGEGERTLYDVLQANKGGISLNALYDSANHETVAAKQAEFEEQSKIRNQFRALDDDEIEFLDEIRANKRAEEERVRRETEEGLKAFRERQKGDTAQEGTADAQEVGESWDIGRKRKRNKEKDGKGFRRKVNGTEEVDKQNGKPAKDLSRQVEEEKPKATTQPAARPPERNGSALVAYGSDSDD
ncbi:nefa-interacting nuclear nip30 [Fusarium heterosporum]|uniref:Nefa-interacting nuclear nip30 n=1 Tax=Fusarium heterosporum TaxID=42747 RepID=A0A8H5T3J8_FUSHE|nr:nefa-interacting nuclear nip30 [Fusarium heterosporum]